MSLLFMALSSTSQSAVIFSFEQVGDDVVIRLDGTFAVQSTPVISSSYSSTGIGFVQIDSGGSFIYEGLSTSYGEYSNAVTRVATGLSAMNYVVAEQTDRYFLLLFTGTARFSDSLLAAGQGPGEARYEFESSLDKYTIANTTLSALGADGFDNTLAWTSNTGDTIHYTVVPEPSSALLLGFSALGFALYRNRMKTVEQGSGGNG